MTKETTRSTMGGIAEPSSAVSVPASFSSSSFNSMSVAMAEAEKRLRKSIMEIEGTGEDGSEFKPGDFAPHNNATSGGSAAVSTQTLQHKLYAELDVLEKHLTQKREAIEEIKAYVSKLWKDPGEGVAGGVASENECKRNKEWNCRLEQVSLAEIKQLENIIDHLVGMRNKARQSYWESYYNTEWSKEETSAVSLSRAYAAASPATTAAAESLLNVSWDRNGPTMPAASAAANKSKTKSGNGSSLHRSANGGDALAGGESDSDDGGSNTEEENQLLQQRASSAAVSTAAAAHRKSNQHHFASSGEGTYVRPQPDAATAKTCHCRKSKCLKLYCDCFAAGDYCKDACHCLECKNNEAAEPAREYAVNAILSRRPNAFAAKVSLVKGPSGELVVPAGALVQHDGCNCKKSQCLKKYCVCFNSKVKCRVSCKCLNCKNGKRPSNKRGKRGKASGKVQTSAASKRVKVVR